MDKYMVLCNECEAYGEMSPYLTDATALAEHLRSTHGITGTDYTGEMDVATELAEAWDEEQYIAWLSKNDPAALDIFNPDIDAFQVWN